MSCHPAFCYKILILALIKAVSIRFNSDDCLIFATRFANLICNILRI